MPRKLSGNSLAVSENAPRKFSGNSLAVSENTLAYIIHTESIYSIGHEPQHAHYVQHRQVPGIGVNHSGGEIRRLPSLATIVAEFLYAGWEHVETREWETSRVDANS